MTRIDITANAGVTGIMTTAADTGVIGIGMGVGEPTQVKLTRAARPRGKTWERPRSRRANTSRYVPLCPGTTGSTPIAVGASHLKPVLGMLEAWWR
jgi:hypothetical protein